MLLHVTIAETGRTALPPLPIVMPADGSIVVGAQAGAAVRLPIGAVAAAHLRISLTGHGWFFVALGDATITTPSRVLPVCAGDQGTLPLPCMITIDRWELQLAEAADGSMPAAAPMRTGSLARELARSLLGGSSAPALTIESGAGVGNRRELPPPEVRITLGRGEDADWQIADGDLSRVHVAIERLWDGVRITDLDSKNGTMVDGRAVPPEGVMLVSGAVITMGGVTLRYDDPAAKLVNDETPPAPPQAVAPVATVPVAATVPELESATIGTADAPWLFPVAVGVCLLAIVAIVWLLVMAITATPVAMS